MLATNIVFIEAHTSSINQLKAHNPVHSYSAVLSQFCNIVIKGRMESINTVIAEGETAFSMCRHESDNTTFKHFEHIDSVRSTSATSAVSKFCISCFIRSNVLVRCLNNHSQLHTQKIKL